MKTTEKNHVVNYLLTQMTFMLLAKSPVKDAIGKASQKHENRLRATLTDEEFMPIAEMRNVVAELATKLANCESVDELQHSYSYIKALVDGEVMVAIPEEATGQIIGYEMNQ